MLMLKPLDLVLAAAVAVAASACIRVPAQQNPPPNYQGDPNYNNGSYGGAPAPSGGGPSYGGAPTPSASSYSPPPPAAPPGPVSVTIRSSCSKTVRVFYGQKPKWGSGTYSTISSNSLQSHSFNQGDMFWIVDDSDNGLSSTSAGPGTREIEILPSCTGFRLN